MNYYILKGDIANYHYQIFGLFTNQETLRESAETIISRDYVRAE